MQSSSNRRCKYAIVLHVAMQSTLPACPRRLHAHHFILSMLSVFITPEMLLCRSVCIADCDGMRASPFPIAAARAAERQHAN